MYEKATGFGVIIGLALILAGVFYPMPQWWAGGCVVLGTFWTIVNTLSLVAR